MPNTFIFVLFLLGICSTKKKKKKETPEMATGSKIHTDQKIACVEIQFKVVERLEASFSVS